jgi:hypothetical protein
MVVTVDEGGHHRLAREIHASRPWWRLTLTLLADPGEGIALDKERGILDRRAAVSDDEARAFEQDRTAASTLEARRPGINDASESDDQTERKYLRQ